MNFRTELDHIVIACNTLAEGRVWCRDTLGIEASGGGKHAGIGTHNMLVSLGPNHYLEIIAIDPDAPPASFPRWFGLDSEEVKTLIAHGPRLVAWVARVARTGSAHDAIEQIAATNGNLANIVRPAHRGDFRWRFAFTADGKRPRHGVLPHFIQWDVPIHPCERLPNVDVRLNSLLLGDPAHDEIGSVLATVNFSDRNVSVAQSTSAQLAATLSARKGQIVLE
jgi:Glyoxalase-like domain